MRYRLLSSACKAFILFCFCNNPAYGQIQQIQRELHTLSSVGDSVSKVNSLNRLGTLYRAINVDSCFYYGMEAKRVATDIGYNRGQTEADHLIAFTFYKKGLYAEALELYGKVLPRYEGQADTVNIVRLYMDKAEVLNKGIVEKREVVALLQRAIQTGSQLANDSIMADVYISYCGRNGDLSADSMKYYLSKAKEIAGRYNDDRLLFYIRQWDAHFLIAEGKRQVALPLLTQLMADAQQFGNANMEINACFLMIYYYYGTDLKKALEYYHRAYDVAQKSGSNNLVNYILTDGLTVAKELGDKEEIIDLYTKLEQVTAEEWERTRKFISDYVRFNTMQQDNELLVEKNAKRTLWLAIISSLAVVVMLAIYLIMLRRNRKAKEQIAALNDAANIQIIAMEEARYQAIKEEQLRLGQDLHDGLSSSIAGIKHQLEILSMDINDASLKSKLLRLQTEVGKAYDVARNKSHEWFSAAGEQEEQSFEQRIKLLTDSALPDSRYQKDVHIDDRTLLRVNADTRISLLRIIQEAITNIIKHAKATKVEVLVYEEMERLVMIVKDNGRGLVKHAQPNQQSAIGIQSIRRRARLLNGELDIDSGEHGTEITITIPVNSVNYQHN